MTGLLRRRLRASVAAVALLTAALHGGAGATAFVDDAGRTLDVRVPPRRVITLAPNLTEFVYAVGAGDVLVGTVDTSDYPEAARHVRRIGNAQRLDVESLLALHPDLVMVWYHGNQGRELEQLSAAGVRMVYLEPRRLEDIPRILERVGSLLGHERQGEARAGQFRRELEGLRAAYATAAPVSVFYQVWPRPLMTLNGEHLTSRIVALCGGHNVFAQLPGLAPQVSVESVVAADPQAIFADRSSDAADPAWRRDPKNADFALWQGFPAMSAVRQGWLFTVPGAFVTRPGPRVIDGIRAVCGALDEVRARRGQTRAGPDRRLPVR